MYLRQFAPIVAGTNGISLILTTVVLGIGIDLKYKGITDGNPVLDENGDAIWNKPIRWKRARSLLSILRPKNYTGKPS